MSKSWNIYFVEKMDWSYLTLCLLCVRSYAHLPHISCNLIIIIIFKNTNSSILHVWCRSIMVGTAYIFIDYEYFFQCHTLHCSLKCEIVKQYNDAHIDNATLQLLAEDIGYSDHLLLCSKRETKCENRAFQWEISEEIRWKNENLSL